MKILKKGKKPEPPKWSLKTTCKKCKSELLVHEEDIKMERLGPGYSAYAEKKGPVVSCPVCQEDIILKDKEVPERYHRVYGDGFSEPTSRTQVE